MRTIDFSPLYRSVVGFDRLAAQLDAAAAQNSASGYPPYNIELLEQDKIDAAGGLPGTLYSLDLLNALLAERGEAAVN